MCVIFAKTLFLLRLECEHIVKQITGHLRVNLNVRLSFSCVIKPLWNVFGIGFLVFPNQYMYLILLKI